MRKLLLLLSILATYASAQTQTLSFCEAFPLLEKSALNGFSDILMEKDPDNPFKTHSRIQLKDAISAGIVKMNHEISYKAEFGSFNTIEEAKKQVEKITASLKNCYPGIKSTVSTEKLIGIEYHTLSIQNEHGFRLYNARFEIFPFKKKFDVSFKFIASEKKDMFNSSPKQAYYDYTLIKRAPANDEFSVAFRNVIEESKTAFSAIIGNSTDFGRGFPCFRTTYRIPGYNSIIEVRSANLIFYVLLGFQQTTPENYIKTVEKARNLIEGALGTGYGFITSTDGSSLTYAHQSQPEKPVVRMIQIEKNGSFVFELQFYNQE